MDRAEIAERVAKLEEDAERRREVLDRLLTALGSPFLPPATRAAVQDSYRRALLEYRQTLEELDALERLARESGDTGEPDGQKG